MNSNLYGASKWWRKEYIKANILHDLSCISNNELIYREGPTLARKKLTSYTKNEMDYPDKISLLLPSPFPYIYTLTFTYTRRRIKYT